MLKEAEKPQKSSQYINNVGIDAPRMFFYTFY